MLYFALIVGGLIIGYAWLNSYLVFKSRHAPVDPPKQEGNASSHHLLNPAVIFATIDEKQG